MSDLVVMEEQAYFADPHVALGLVAADGGAVMWPTLTSLLRAKEYILLGDRLSAEGVAQHHVGRLPPDVGHRRQVVCGLGNLAVLYF